ncbi:hypothetical protein C0989_000039 [Termitomyces sp. Mn162]|nr:hypothetical protein C0989_000039 [Termitomyces sp. Mn162]
MESVGVGVILAGGSYLLEVEHLGAKIKRKGIPHAHDKNLIPLGGDFLTEDFGEAKQTSSITGRALREYDDRPIRILSQAFEAKWRFAIAAIHIAKGRYLTSQSNNCEEGNRLKSKNCNRKGVCFARWLNCDLEYEQWAGTDSPEL